MYNICICEEDKNLQKSLENIISSYFIIKDIKVKIESFDELSQLNECAVEFDMVFLDVDNNCYAAIETACMLLNKYPQMYLYILSDKYSCLDEAMDIRAFRYLSKPPEIKRLFRSLDIVTSRRQDVDFVSNYMPVQLNESQIVCIYSQQRRTIVLTDVGEEYQTTMSIKRWLDKTSDFSDFLHPHYSYIINKNYVSSFNGKAITIRCKDGKTMDVYPSQRKLAEVKAVLSSALQFNV